MKRRGGEVGEGIGFFGLLALMFIGLRISNVIDWPWWWVLAPIWMPAAIVFGVFAVFLLIEWR